MPLSSFFINRGRYNMKLLKGVVLAIGLLIGVAGCQISAPQTDDIPMQVVQWSLDNVWKVRSGGGSGSGFSIDEDYFVTACHVVVDNQVYGEKPLFLINERDTRVVQMEVIVCNRNTDVAVLKRVGGDEMESTFGGFHPQPEIGKAMWGAGHPMGGPLMITQGHAQMTDPTNFKSWAYFASFNTVPGDSGSPAVALYDGRPLVVGIRLAVSTVPLGWAGVDLAMHMTLVAPYRNIIDEIRTAKQLVAVRTLNSEI